MRKTLIVIAATSLLKGQANAATDCRQYPAALAGCQPFMCRDIDPLMHQPVTRYVNGFKKERCMAWDELPGGMVQVCLYKEGSHQKVAGYLAQVIDESKGKPSKTSFTFANNPAQAALNTGECKMYMR